MARVKQKSENTIWRQIRQGTFHPAPTGTNPYSWQKADVMRYFEQLRAIESRPAGTLTH